MIDLTNRKWRPFSRALNAQNGFYPNCAFYNADDRELAIVIDKSPRGDDFALSQKALDYLMVAQGKQEKVLRSFVVLRDREANAIVTLPASDVQNNIRDAEPWKGRFGPFWWINIDFCRASIEVDVDPIF
ncbi:MAG: hypothetical protein P8Y71_07275 [Pseudolabrys sp.]|jgi:hypothetical protein